MNAVQKKKIMSSRRSRSSITVTVTVVGDREGQAESKLIQQLFC
jgi:hypothetical protein